MSKLPTSLLIAMRLCLALLFVTVSAQAQGSFGAATDKRSDATTTLTVLPRNGFSLTHGMRMRTYAGSTSTSINITPMAGGPNLQVLGSGTVGRLTKWTGLNSSNSFIGDTTIFETKEGLVGIGTDSPASKLTVAGMIQTTLGGIKFPDGSVQTTALSADQVVSSLNGLTGNVTLAAGSNISIFSSGNTLTIAAPNALSAVAHDTTLQGNGTTGSPLGVAIPLDLRGSAPGISSNLILVVNSGDFGAGIRAIGGSGGTGVTAEGGFSSNHGGGTGLIANGGGSTCCQSGDGALIRGGDSGSGPGGFGLGVTGGRGSNSADLNRGGTAISAAGGESTNGGIRGFAAKFTGDTEINGNLSVMGVKAFKIDHPLDPENKYLYHAAIESSEVLNVYSGNVTTNESGEAMITLPGWFEALNRDFRYQLTVVRTFAQAVIADEIQNNSFKIRTNAPGVKVSWQVTGVRSDAVMLKHPFKIEEDKSERGAYLNPEAFGQPEEKGVEWARNPAMMKQMKESRAKQIEESKQKIHGNDH